MKAEVGSKSSQSWLENCSLCYCKQNKDINCRKRQTMVKTLEEWEGNSNTARKWLETIWIMLKEPIKKTKKPTQLCILFRATKCRSIPVLQHYFLYKNQIFIYTASILDTCYINFFLIQQKRKVIKHQSTPGLRSSSCHSTWSILEMRVSMRSTFTEGRRTRQLSELELGRTETQFS